MKRFLRTIENRTRTWVQPSWFLPAMLLTYAVFEGFYAYARWHEHARQADLQQIIGSRDLMIVLFVGAAGFLRAKTNHPLFWVDYGRWLARTPWRLPRPLPFGPVYLAWADIVFVAIVSLALHDPFFNPLRIPLLFLTGYLAVVCASFVRTGVKTYGYILAFGLGLVVRFWMNPWYATEVAGVLYPIAFLGLRQSLRNFPWSIAPLPAAPEPPIKLTLSTDVNQWLAQKRPKLLGWPFDLLRPGIPRSALDPRDGMALSLLLAWWVYVSMANLEADVREALLSFAVIAAPCYFALARLARFTTHYRPPISFWGRIFTLRWIIPGYDKILIAPLLAVAISWAAHGWFIDHLGLDPLVVAPIAIGGSLLAVLNIGPALHEWRHTGCHRIVPVYPTTTHHKL